MKCGCRKWDLSGIPCLHAVSAICSQGFDVEMYVHPCYRLETYKRVYEPAIMPINGRSEWNKSNFVPPLPPNDGRTVGRPTEARRVEPDEVVPKKKKRSRGKPSFLSKTNPERLKRQQTTYKCKFFGQEGHISRGCELKKEANRARAKQKAAAEAERQFVAKVERQVTEEAIAQASQTDMFSQVTVDNAPTTNVYPTAKGKLKVAKKKNPQGRSQKNNGKAPFRSPAIVFPKSVTSSASHTPLVHSKNSGSVPNSKPSPSPLPCDTPTTQMPSQVSIPSYLQPSVLRDGPSMFQQLQQVHMAYNINHTISLSGIHFPRANLKNYLAQCSYEKGKSVDKEKKKTG